jgi:hypothetical protein
MQEKEPVAQNMDEIVIDNGRNQYGEKTCLPKKLPFLLPVVCV